MTVSSVSSQTDLAEEGNGVLREDGYDITVASEIMAILCLSKDIADLKERLGKIIVGYTYGKIAEQKPVTAHVACRGWSYDSAFKGCY